MAFLRFGSTPSHSRFSSVQSTTTGAVSNAGLKRLDCSRSFETTVSITAPGLIFMVYIA